MRQQIQHACAVKLMLVTVDLSLLLALFIMVTTGTSKVPSASWQTRPHLQMSVFCEL